MLKSWNEMRKLDISKYVKKRDGAEKIYRNIWNAEAGESNG